MESGNTDKTTVHLANENPTENYGWQQAERDTLAVLASVIFFHLPKGSVYSDNFIVSIAQKH